MKNKIEFIDKTFEELQFGTPLQFIKMHNVTDKAKKSVMGIVESKFYNTRSLLCFDFYKHISRVISKNGI